MFFELCALDSPWTVVVAELRRAAQRDSAALSAMIIRWCLKWENAALPKFRNGKGKKGREREGPAPGRAARA